MGFLADSKDRLVEKAVLLALNKSILQPYGRATSLRIDSTAKTIEFSVELKGETELVQVQIMNYELIKEGDGSYLVLRQVQTSRAWLTTLAEELLLNRRLKLPVRAAQLLFRFL